MIDYNKHPRRTAQPSTPSGASPQPSARPATRGPDLVAWDQLLAHVHRRYAVSTPRPDHVVFDVPTDQGSSHLVSMRRTSMKGSQQREWVVLQSPICETGSADAIRVAARAGLYMVGGVVADKEFMSLRHAMTLPLVELHDLDAAIDAVGSCAFKIGAWLRGTYRYD